MFYWLTELSDKISFFNVFRYITFRTGGAIVTALVFVFLLGGPIIDLLRLKQGKGQPIRSDGPPSHLVTKKGTPTMGGLMILSGLLVSTLLWANPRSPYVWVVLGVIGARSTMPPGTWRARPGMPAAVAVGLAITFAYLTMESFLPLLLRELKDLPLILAGMPLTAAAIFWTAGAWYQARLPPERRPRVAAIGGFVSAAGLAVAARHSDHHVQALGPLVSLQCGKIGCRVRRLQVAP